MVFGIWPNRSILNIIIIHIIIHIIIIIFLLCTASTNLIAYFLLKPMGICFLHYWPVLTCFKSFVLYPIIELQPLVSSFQPTLMIEKPCKCTPNSPLRSVYCIINYPNLLNISTGIPIGCYKAEVAIFQN